MQTRPWRIVSALAVLVIAGLLAYFVITTNHPGSKYQVKQGLDLAGGTELVYVADTSAITTDKQGALESLRDVIDRRINQFGVAEPLIQLERSSSLTGTPEDRLLVELPGVTDVQAAKNAIGQTPVLDFKLVSVATSTTASSTATSSTVYTDTGLTGRYLASAELQFTTASTNGGLANAPIVVRHLPYSSTVR
jgi:preprotein translocase subunit SecD